MIVWADANHGKYYTQLDGVAMGSPIAPLMADVFMNWLVDNVSKIGCSPHILCLYVDDIFCAFDSRDEMDKFFHNLNNTWKLYLFLEHQYQPVSSFLLTAAILVYPYLQLKHCLCTLHK